MDEQKPQKTVLLVDDDVEFTTNLGKRFEAAGIGVKVAVTGQEALDYLNSHDVDFIILDFIMPEMDGFEFYHTLTHDMRKNIPTIVLTNLRGAKETENLEVLVKTDTDLGQLVQRVKEKIGA